MVETETKVKRYERYKASGVEWLGEIPEHWQANKLKYVLTEINERSETGEEELLSLSKTKGVIPKSTLGDRSGQASSLIGYKKVYIQSLVLNKMQAVNGLLSVSKINGITSPDYSIYKTIEDNDINYFGYLLNQPIYLDEFKKVVTGVMEGFIRLYTDDLYNIKAHIPPLNEQTKIAQFLDDKTTKIDEAISIKEQQISLLKERKQILIHKAVTQGLNSNVTLKDSGVEWIGEIPEHWEVTAVKYILDIPITDGPHTTPELLDNGIPFISAEAIKNGEIDFNKKRGFISEKDHQLFCLKYSPKRDDIYMVKSGATTGNIAMVKTDKEFSIWSPLAVFRANLKRILPQYLYIYLESSSFKKGVELSWSFGTQQNIGMGVLSNLPISFPSVQEQKEISAYIETASQKIETAIGLKQQEIEKLKEYKSSLINGVVTGKVRVC